MGRMWQVPAKMVEVLMECLLRARHCARPVHSPADSLLSTYCMPGSMQGARDSRVNKHSIPALLEGGQMVELLLPHRSGLLSVYKQCLCSGRLEF